MLGGKKNERQAEGEGEKGGKGWRAESRGAGEGERK